MTQPNDQLVSCRSPNNLYLIGLIINSHFVNNDQGLYINDIILFRTILDPPPSPLSSRHLLAKPPPPLDDIINVYQDYAIHDRAEIEQILENKSYQSILGDPKTVFEPYPNLKNSPLGPQKVKNDPKIKSKSNVRI